MLQFKYLEQRLQITITLIKKVCADYIPEILAII
jgi:hypothetical protein